MWNHGNPLQWYERMGEFILAKIDLHGKNAQELIQTWLNQLLLYRCVKLYSRNNIRIGCQLSKELEGKNLDSDPPQSSLFSIITQQTKFFLFLMVKNNKRR